MRSSTAHPICASLLLAAAAVAAAVGIISPVVAGIVVIALILALGPSRGSKDDHSSIQDTKAAVQAPKRDAQFAALGPEPVITATSTAQYPLALPQWGIAAVTVGEKDMDWFEDLVGNLFAVNIGIFCGTLGGEPIPSWPKGHFRKALHELRSGLGGDPWRTGLGYHEPLDDVVLSARLIATDLNVPKAAGLVYEYLQYRQETRGGVVPGLRWIRSGVAIVPFEDFLGRPVVFVRPRYHRKGDVQTFISGLRASVDTMLIHMLRKRKPGTDKDVSCKNLLEQYILVFDFAGAGMANFDLQALKATLYSGTHHYPNRIAQTFAIHVGRSTKVVYNMAAKLMHPRTQRKTQMISSSEVPSCMKQIAPLHLLPPEYGGTAAAWPEPSAATCLEEQVGDLAAAMLVQSGVVPYGALPPRKELENRSRSPVSTSKSKPKERKAHLTCCMGRCG